MSKKNIKIAIFGIVSLVLIFSIALIMMEIGNSGAEPFTEANKKAEEPFRILVTGKDEVSGLSDVIMLVSFDTHSKKACIMQIPRDTYAEYGNSSHRKLNSAANLMGGEKKLCEFLSKALEIDIDGYVSLELDAFKKAVDAVGGVEIELKKTLYYDDPEQNLHIYLPKGKQVLDGEKAEMLVRYRSGYSRGDLDRLDAQKTFLAAMFFKVKESVNISNAYGLASALLPNIRTDISAPMLMSIALKGMKLEAEDVGFMTLPGEGVLSAQSGASFYVMSASATNRALKEYFGKSTEEIDEEKLFLHPTHENFQDVYEKDCGFDIEFAHELG